MILNNLFSKVIDNAEGIIDKVVTTDKERDQLKIELEKVLLDAQKENDRQISERWKADMMSDSWLSKNVRPLTLMFLVVCTVLVVFIDSGSIAFQVEDKWVDLLQLVLITVIGAYFGGRSIEKIKRK